MPGRGRLHGLDLAPASAESANPLSQVFLVGTVAAGFPLIDDFNGVCAEGARQSAAAACSHPVSHRTNPTISTESRVQRLRVEGSRCVGVDSVYEGDLVTAYADAEVGLPSLGSSALRFGRITCVLLIVV